jgi:hypothetical protein
MKTRILTALSTLAIMTALFFVFPSRSTTNAATPNTVVPQERREQAEDLHRAEDKLKEARALLAGAPGEFGGHREKAIARVDEALGEVREAWEHRSR